MSTPHIVITTINRPTPAVQRFSTMPEHRLVVVGDRKTPSDWACSNTTFLGVDNAETRSFALEKRLPHNHYCRKMLGYIYAARHGATSIIDTDDDNIPKSDWTFPPLEGDFGTINTAGKHNFINIYNYFTTQKIWPRGLPLDCINETASFDALPSTQQRIGVWQGLADDDPDVDAIYRLTSNAPCRFENKRPVVLTSGIFCPYNSQNTLTRRELFALLYLPGTVTFRFTDILRGIIAQPIMWAHGYTLGFTRATVVQERNEHDLYKDFVSEIPMYTEIVTAKDVALACANSQRSVSENLYATYTALFKEGIVKQNELISVEAWLRDICTE